MFVLFKNTDRGNFAINAKVIHHVVRKNDEEGTIVTYEYLDGDEYEFNIDLPVETVVGLINQALGQTAVPDQPEKSVVIIEGK